MGLCLAVSAQGVKSDQGPTGPILGRSAGARFGLHPLHEPQLTTLPGTSRCRPYGAGTVFANVFLGGSAFIDLEHAGEQNHLGVTGCQLGHNQADAGPVGFEFLAQRLEVVHFVPVQLIEVQH